MALLNLALEIRNMIRSTLLLRRTTYQCFTQLNLCSDVSQNTENVCINPFVFNRNPRNLERLRIAYKPSGYHLEKPGREYWHKLEVTQSNRHVSASLLHCSGKRVLETSTREWSIRKHLYRLRGEKKLLKICPQCNSVIVFNC